MTTSKWTAKIPERGDVYLDSTGTQGFVVVELSLYELGGALLGNSARFPQDAVMVRRLA